MVHPHGNQEEFFVDIGAYGNPKTDNYHYSETVRRIEKFVRDTHGWVFNKDVCIAVFVEQVFSKLAVFTIC